MIEQLAGALRLAGIDTDAVELAEILWVATHRRWEAILPAHQDGASGVAEQPMPRPAGQLPLGSEPDDATDSPMYLIPPRPHAGQAVEVRLPGPVALPDRLPLARALRVFKHRYPTSRISELDLDATVDFYGETGLFVPLRRPGSERWFDVTLVVDGGPTMDVWTQTVTELTRLLAGHGAFRRVRRLHLIDGRHRPSLLTDSGTRVHPPSVAGSDGRHLIMVISDCVGAAWYRDALWRTLRGWGTRAPVVVVQTLPQRLWESTALGPADARVSSLRPGQPNSGLRITQPWWSTDDDHHPAVIPIVGLTEPELTCWARMVMGGANVLVPGVFIDADRDEPPALSTTSAVARVAAFKATVSIEAYQLAVCLAAVPIRLPVARIVQYAVVGSRDPVHLAEVFASGLIRRETPAGTNVPPDDVIYEFWPGVRELLQRSLTGSRTLDIHRAVAHYLEQIFGASGSFTALLSDTINQTEANAALLPFAEVGRPLLERLGVSVPFKIQQPPPTAEWRSEAGPLRTTAKDAVDEVRRVSDRLDTEPVSRRAELPARTRVYVLARLLGRSSRDVLGALADLGIDGLRAQSSIDKQTASRVITSLGLPNGETFDNEPATGAARTTARDRQFAGPHQSAKTAELAGARVVLVAQMTDPVSAGSRVSVMGTGYAVGTRLVLTASHLVQPDGWRTVKVRAEPGPLTTSGWIDCQVVWADRIQDAAILAVEEDLVGASSLPVPWATIVDAQPLAGCRLVAVSLSRRSDLPFEDNQLPGTLYPGKTRLSFELERRSMADQPAAELALSGGPVLFGDTLIGIATTAEPTSRRINVIAISSLSMDREFANITAPYLRQGPLVGTPPATTAGIQPAVGERDKEHDRDEAGVSMGAAPTSISEPQFAAGAGSRDRPATSGSADLDEISRDVPMPVDTSGQAVKDSGYLYDVFLSYPRSAPGNSSGWVRNHFYPLLLDCLTDQLSWVPTIFFDLTTETDTPWPAAQADALRRSKLLVAVWSPPYFRSAWCLAELASMMARERQFNVDSPGKSNSLIYPVVYSGDQNFPSYARERQARNLKQWSNPFPSYRDSMGYERFYEEMRDVATEIARMLVTVPPWQPGWSAHRIDLSDSLSDPAEF